MNKNFKISVIHPTCRPKIARQTREEWLDLSSDPDSVDYILSLDSSTDKNNRVSRIKFNSLEIYNPLSNDKSIGPVQKMNLASKFASSNCLLFVADDFETYKDWDYDITNTTDWNKDVVLKITDNTDYYQKVHQPFLIYNPAISKKRYHKYGFFGHPSFFADFSDTYLSWLAHKDNVVIENEKIKFFHNPQKYIPENDSFDAERRFIDNHQAGMHEWKEHKRACEVFVELAIKNINKSEVQNLIEEYSYFATKPRKKNIEFVLESVGVDLKKLT